MSEHTAALIEENRIVCSCGTVCDARIGKSPERIMGSKSDYFVAVRASSVFAQHLKTVGATS